MRITTLRNKSLLLFGSTSLAWKGPESAGRMLILNQNLGYLMRLTKLATALVAMAAFAPLSASAGPSITNVEQINQTVEAVYSNNFAQSASVSGAANVGIAAGDVVDTGAGITNDAVYTLTPNLTNLTNSISIVGGTVTPITKPTTVTAQMADNTGTGVLSLDTSALAGDAVSVSTTVFGVSSIKASQSIVQSMTTSAF